MRGFFYFSRLELSEIQLTQVFFNHCGWQRNIAILYHHFLSLAGQNHLQEFTLQRRQRLVWLLVHINIEEASQWVAVVYSIRWRCINKITTRFLRQRHSTNTGSLVADTRVTQPIDGCRNRLHDRRRTGLFVNIVAEVTFTQRYFLEVAIGSGYRVTAVKLDRTIFPGTRPGQPAPKW